MAITTTIYSFSSLSDARLARDALIAAGFHGDRVRLRSLNDEAGPVEGNFAIGNGRTADKPGPSGALAGREGAYERNIERQVDRGTQLMEVDAGADEDEQRARAIAQAHHGIDLAARNPGR